MREEAKKANEGKSLSESESDDIYQKRSRQDTSSILEVGDNRNPQEDSELSFEDQDDDIGEEVLVAEEVSIRHVTASPELPMLRHNELM